MSSADACPCGRTGSFGRLDYASCCGRFLDGGADAPDAQALMRSRYTAYALRRNDYLLATWDPAHRPDTLDDSAGTTWLGLEVLDHQVLDGDHAEVEFIARFRAATGPARALRERSRFVRRDGRWLYLDAVTPRTAPPTGGGRAGAG